MKTIFMSFIVFMVFAFASSSFLFAGGTGDSNSASSEVTEIEMKKVVEEMAKEFMPPSEDMRWSRTIKKGSEEELSLVERLRKIWQADVNNLHGKLKNMKDNIVGIRESLEEKIKSLTDKGVEK